MQKANHEYETTEVQIILWCNFAALPSASLPTSAMLLTYLSFRNLIDTGHSRRFLLHNNMSCEYGSNIILCSFFENALQIIIPILVGNNKQTVRPKISTHIPLHFVILSIQQVVLQQVKLFLRNQQIALGRFVQHLS